MKVFTVLLGLVASIVLFTLAYNEQNTNALIAGMILFTASAFLCYLVVINWIDKKHEPTTVLPIKQLIDDYAIEWLSTNHWQVIFNNTNTIVHNGTLGECRTWIKDRKSKP